jgi:hypothetical protein
MSEMPIRVSRTTGAGGEGEPLEVEIPPLPEDASARQVLDWATVMCVKAHSHDYNLYMNRTKIAGAYLREYHPDLVV